MNISFIRTKCFMYIYMNMFFEKELNIHIHAAMTFRSWRWHRVDGRECPHVDDSVCLQVEIV